MTGAFISHARPDGKVVAHSLDFDLVAVGADEEGAFRKLRLALKTYLEYGLSNGWVDDICFPAPSEYWEPFLKATSMRSMDPIEIDDDRQMIVVHATMTNSEHRQVACQAS
jgi:hypothetical protein